MCHGFILIWENPWNLGCILNITVIARMYRIICINDLSGVVMSMANILVDETKIARNEENLVMF